MSTTLTSSELRNLCAEFPTLGVATVGQAFGLGRSASYDLAARGEFPVPLIRVGGKRLRCRSSDVLTALGLTHG
jgi:predicted DNA-binding transcriptional regulator AlpA